MRISIVHGYLLDDSGSAVYVRELTRQMVRLGHDVTLICQEQNSQSHDFINSFYRFDIENNEPKKLWERKTSYKGYCRLVIPNIGGNLFVYFPVSFPGFKTATFQESPMTSIKSYMKANIKAVTKVFQMWPPDLVQANHVIMQPYIVNKSLKGNQCPYIVTVHGSALNFTVKKDKRMVPYAVEGLNNASSVVTASYSSLEQVKKFATEKRINIINKLKVITPGVDAGLFRPPKNLIEARKILLPNVHPRDDILAFSGRLIWTKGLPFLIAALPLMLKKRPNIKLFVVGEGPMEGLLKQLVNVFNIESRVKFLGHLDHEHLSKLLSVTNITVAPSVFPEGFGLVFIEALASGSLPVATYSGGFRFILDSIGNDLPEPALRSLKPKGDFSAKIAETVTYLLDSYPTKEISFRKRLHRIAVRHFSWERTAKEYTKLYANFPNI